jgi:hypothetical protein
MGFRYQLSTPDGELFDEVEYGYQPNAGDEVYVNGNPPHAGALGDPGRARG